LGVARKAAGLPMPSVLCGLGCFDVAGPTTAGVVAGEFLASLDPALETAGCAVEVYRLQRVAPETPLTAEDAVLCRMPSWQFELSDLEDMHAELEDLRNANETLKAQYSSVKDALLALNMVLDDKTNEESPLRSPEPGFREIDGESHVHREVHQLRQKEQETKATVKALRSQFAHLLELWSNVGGPCFQDLQLTFFPNDEVDNGSLQPLQQLWTQEVSRSPRAISTSWEQLDMYEAKPAVRAKIGTGNSGGRRQAGAAPRTHRCPTTICTPRPWPSTRSARDCTGAARHPRLRGRGGH